MARTTITGKQIGDDSIVLGTDTSGTLPVNEGGTNATTAAAARTNLAVPEASGFAKITVASSAPGSPSTGDLWVDTS